jgi:hypothetical protein
MAPVNLRRARSSIATSFYRAAGLGHTALLAMTRAKKANERYAIGAPSAQQVLDIFKGEWLSVLPAPYCECEAGRVPLFGDPRLTWAVERLGGVTNSRVLELGPLEGGHTWMLEQLGAGEITAIEASDRAYLRCLAVKELTGIRRARFLFGDSVVYLRETGERFDVAIASGILYHMTNPAELIALLAAHCDRLFLWTHYYDDAALRRLPKLRARFAGTSEATHDGFTHTRYRFHYRATRFRLGFAGGHAAYSHWLTRDAILAACRHFGFQRVEMGLDEPNHPYGPCCGFVATRG